MNLSSRFFGHRDAGSSGRHGELIANAAIESPLSLQLLFTAPLRLDANQVTLALQAYDESMDSARFEIDENLNAKEQIVVAMAGWGDHVVRLVGFDTPMPEVNIEACIAPAHYSQELKNEARGHTGHLLLYYGGYEPSPFEQYVALGAVAGVLANFGALVVLNESAMTSLPAIALGSEGAEGHALELLRSLPLPILFCGFVKYELEGVDGVWMRTHGAELLSWPDLAVHADDHDHAEKYFGIFDNVFQYLRDSGALLADGHTMQVGDETYIRFRKPASNEPFVESESNLLVVEMIRADEINA
jgi:hypothetical protein